MKVIICDKIMRVIKGRKKLEETLGVKIINRGKEVKISGPPEKEYIAEKVIDALNFGFPFETALNIAKKGYDFETISIREYAKTKALERVRGRVIGSGGRALHTLSNLTECAIELKDNQLGIIGDPELFQRATEAVIALIKGAKHSNVYSGLEKTRPEPIHDLGLRDDNKL